MQTMTVMKRCGICSLVLLLSLANASAQTGTIEGTVVDRSGSPVPGANVIVEGTTIGSAADVRGNFVISAVPAGTHAVAASAVGFRRTVQEVSVGPGDRAAVRFVLSEITLQSGEVVVTAGRREQAALTAPVSIDFLTPRDIERRNVLTIDEALRQVPGVQLVDNQVNIRGSSGFAYGVGTRVLVLVDGVPMLGADQGDIKYDAFPLSQVERIEVTKGPGSALYGGNALGGVVNIITRDFPARPETRLKLYGGGYQPVRYPEWRMHWDGADDVRFLGGATLTHARRVGERFGFWTNLVFNEDQGYVSENTERNLQGYAKVGWRPSPSISVDLLGGYNRTRREIFLFWNSARDPLRLRRTEFITGGNRGVSEQISVLPVFRHVVNPQLFYTVKARFFGISFKPADFRWRIRPKSWHTYGERVGGEVQVNYAGAFDTYVTGGFTADWSQAESSFFRGEDDVRRRFQPEAGVFLQAERGFLERWTVVGGLRFDAYQIDEERIESQLSPKINVAYRASELLTVRGSYGHGFRVPSVAERYVSSRDFLPLDPNPLLLPEESIGYELGLRGLVPFGGQWGARWDAAGFWTEYRHLVEPKFIRGRNAFQFINLTRARIRGFEASVQIADLNDAAAFSLAYTYLDPRDLTDMQPLVFRSRHLLQISGDGNPIGPLEIGFDFRYASRPDRYDTDFGAFVQDSHLMVPVRVLDVRAGTRVSWPQPEVALRLSVIVKNALEYYYVERPALLAPPRHALLQLVAEF